VLKRALGHELLWKTHAMLAVVSALLLLFKFDLAPPLALAGGAATFVLLWLGYLSRPTAWLTLGATWLYASAACGLFATGCWLHVLGHTASAVLGGAMGLGLSTFLVVSTCRELIAPAPSC
jgi:hypothetical protein